LLKRTSIKKGHSRSDQLTSHDEGAGKNIEKKNTQKGGDSRKKKSDTGAPRIVKKKVRRRNGGFSLTTVPPSPMDESTENAKRTYQGVKGDSRRKGSLRKKPKGSRPYQIGFNKKN